MHSPEQKIQISADYERDLKKIDVFKKTAELSNVLRKMSGWMVSQDSQGMDMGVIEIFNVLKELDALESAIRKSTDTSILEENLPSNTSVDDIETEFDGVKKGFDVGYIQRKITEAQEFIQKNKSLL